MQLVIERLDFFLQKPKIKKYFKRLVVLFAFAVGLGFFAGKQNPEEAMLFWEELQKMFGDIEEMGVITIFLLIFFNNTVKAFVFMLMGLFAGIAPVVLVFSNGVVLGLVAYIIKTQESLVSFVIPILPHGIIELFALFLSASYGIWLGNIFIKLIFKKQLFNHFKKDFKFIMIKFLRVIMPLFFVASVIEVTISVFVINLFNF